MFASFLLWCQLQRNSQQLLLAKIRNNYRSSLLGGRGPTAESLAPTLMGMGDGELFVLKLILRTFGAALLQCVPRLLWLVVGHAGLTHWLPTGT